MNSPSDYHVANFAARLAETARMWRNELDARLVPLGLSQARGLILHYLAVHGDGLQQNALADIVGIRGSTLVRQLDRLESDGWLERRDDPADRRAKTIHLARKAAPLVAKLEAKIQELRHELLSGLSDAQFEACFFVMDHIQKRIGSNNQEGDRDAG